MAAWFFKLEDGQEQGPLNFQELATLLASGELSEGDQVRREDATEWQTAANVVGLIREARRIASGEAASSSVLSEQTEKSQTDHADKVATNFHFGRRQWLVVASVCSILLLVTELIWFWLSRPERFPPSVKAPMRFNVPSRLDQMLPPVPREPSVPHLAVREPLLVPGLEHVGWMKQPTLSADMLTIVYVTYKGETGDGETLDDLYIADRPSVDADFGPPRPLEYTITSDRESLPALSPDGLELIHTVMDEQFTLWHSRRTSRDEPFSPPEQMTIEDDAYADWHHDGVQFIDDNSIRFSVSGPPPTHKQKHHFVAERPNRQRPFRVSDRLSVLNPWPRLQLGSNGRRLYYPFDDGFYISARASGTAEFVIPELLIDGTVVGPDLRQFSGSIWLSPNEDVIFYCSPGPGAQDPESHRLWMVRLH